MKILFIIDEYYSNSNGTSVSTQRFIKELEKRGHEIRIVTCNHDIDYNNDIRAYFVNRFEVPIVTPLNDKHGMSIAVPTKSVVTHALSWCDICHFTLPFLLEQQAVHIAKKLDKPYTASFHVQPENISSTFFLGNNKTVNDAMFWYFNHFFYRYVKHVHVPSEFMARELLRHKYRNKIHVISNGIDNERYFYREHSDKGELADKFIILMTGRLAVEKRQNILLEAVAKSKYKDKIQVTLAGKGPREQALRKLASELNLNPIIDFYSREALIEVIKKIDLYVHCSAMESEAMSCMEAFACGRVPIIANSKKSATMKFALDKRCLFRVDDSTDLSLKIDYFIEHPELRFELEQKYQEFAKSFSVTKSVDKFEQMLNLAIKDSKHLHRGYYTV